MSSKNKCKKCPKTNECYACDYMGCNKCVKTACSDCGVDMCENCSGSGRPNCGCYGRCSSCGDKVNRGEHGWPCCECDQWLCHGCRRLYKCKCNVYGDDEENDDKESDDDDK